MLFANEDVGHFDVKRFVVSIFNQWIHRKRVNSIASAALKIIANASLIIHRIGIGLAEIESLLDQYAINQVETLLGNKNLNCSTALASCSRLSLETVMKLKSSLIGQILAERGHATLILSMAA